ncbi:holliday junction DNA helicase RuvA [Candidatus Planktophila sulfonica]|jgi:Holliday junction DNA helicase RuvA|uniref:Holliday junction branch migration complex subunit RuvA n=1 Tax=Candidatus Planktophila sulfonica TaxID=1884904 RepID=A0A249KGU5_9ACTN|nr:Holliday junction branch migration protein RuvA [Candidatus Planktophila sulfonica]ASY15997.1 holliday junction DNA helicase RuvA [Candidatus Planktophila sulfonica]
MISLINGIVRSISSDRAVVEVGGVGLAVSLTSQTTAQLNLGTPVQLFTSLVVREDSLTLFGFLDEESRSAFELVQTVSGIGPKVALAILGAHTPQSLAVAIAQEDIKAIEKVPGIGRKGAQRLILELKGKISDFGSVDHKQIHQPVWREQLTSALISLGFTAKDSDSAITAVVSQYADNGIDAQSVDISELLKAALQSGRRA